MSAHPSSSLNRTLASLLLSLPLLVETASAQTGRGRSVSKPEADNSVAAELKSFTLADGYKANLFADETDGIANPVSMNWDPAGRLWVLTTMAYPQIVPTDEANDKLIILEDTDGDGRADKSTVFADDLNMPTGFALGHGGVYIGEGADLLHLSDTDGDGKSDSRRVLLTGFGTGDTHQNINSFTWSPGGELLMSQGLHAFSRVETPWGISRMNEHGTLRLRPLRMQLETFPRSGGSNPWGFAFGNWGEPFSKSNGPDVYDLLPALVHGENMTGRSNNALSIGRTKIKGMIIEFPESPHLPDDIQGDLLSAGYFGRLIDRFSWSAEGSGHRLGSKPPLLTSSHNAFRPVDIRIGPDGAIYIADWFNPIIGHYQASLRHPNRDKTHGRVWRITAKGRPLAKAPDLSKTSVRELCQHLESDWRYVRYQAKRRLADLPAEEALPAIEEWIANLDASDANLERHLFEALGVFASHEIINRPLLKRLLSAKDYRARAYATRVAGRWSDRLESPLELLQQSVADKNPRVRLEAIVACGNITDADAMVTAAKAVNLPMDGFMNYALTLTTHALAPHWLPALKGGRIRFSQPQELIFVLRAYGGDTVAGQVRNLLTNSGLDADSATGLKALLVRVGTPQDLDRLLVQDGMHPAVLDAFVERFELKGTRPPGDVTPTLTGLLGDSDPQIRQRAIRLVGVWNVAALTGPVERIMTDEAETALLRSEALIAFGKLRGRSVLDEISALAQNATAPAIRIAGLQALSDLEISRAAQFADQLLRDAKSDDQVRKVLTPFLGRKNGAAHLANTLKQDPLSPALATRIRSVLGASGRFDPALDQVLRPAADKDAVGLPEYSETYVQALSAEVKQHGDAANGAKVYAKPVLSCVACHKLGAAGGILGPELTAVGAGLPVELLIEAILWPERQLKEGFIATNITTEGGKVISGYVETEDKERVIIRDAVAGSTQVIPAKQIANRTDAGTLMPQGLTAGLSRAQLRDLIRYLSEQSGR